MIYIIITTCIHNKYGIHNDNHRKNIYIENIKHLLKQIQNDSSIKPIIVENNGLRKTYLDDLDCDILYTNNNRIQYKHKGQNELLDIKQVIHTYNIKDNDIIIKLTGRYKLLNSNFLNLVKNNHYDAFIKFFNVCTKKYCFDDCVLGLFAIRCKYLKEFNYNFIRSPECEFADYVRKHIIKIMEIQELDLECCFADDLRILIV
jgi:hypothetical protein